MYISATIIALGLFCLLAIISFWSMLYQDNKKLKEKAEKAEEDKRKAKVDYYKSRREIFDLKLRLKALENSNTEIEEEIEENKPEDTKRCCICGSTKDVKGYPFAEQKKLADGYIILDGVRYYCPECAAKRDTELHEEL